MRAVYVRVCERWAAGWTGVREYVSAGPLSDGPASACRSPLPPPARSLIATYCGLLRLIAIMARRRPAPSACEPSAVGLPVFCCGGQRARAARIRRACVAPRAVCGRIAPAAPQAAQRPLLPTPRRSYRPDEQGVAKRLPRHASVVRSDERADPLRHCRALDPPGVDGVQLRRTGR